jgi:lipid-A-disaccharide synthase-like uncharacterized protein
MRTWIRFLSGLALAGWMAGVPGWRAEAQHVPDAGSSATGTVTALAQEVDALRGAEDPATQERLLDNIADLHSELRARQGEVSFWVRYWHGFRLRLLTPIFLIGLVGQILFAGRFLVQWLVSVRRGESTVPLAFWYLSIAGSCLVLTYGIVSKEPVIILGQIGLFIYLHNLVMIRRAREPKPLLPEG